MDRIIIKQLFNKFSEQNNLKNIQTIWEQQSDFFRKFWRDKILNGGEFSEDIDKIINILNYKGKGAREFRKKGGYSVGGLGQVGGRLRQVFSDLREKPDIRDILNKLFISKNDQEKIDFIDKLKELKEVDKKNIKGLIGGEAIILNTLLSAYNPNQYVNAVSFRQRDDLMKSFGLGDPIRYSSYGERVIGTNRDIILGFKEKYGIDTPPFILSHFIYTGLVEAYPAIFK